MNQRPSCRRGRWVQLARSILLGAAAASALGRVEATILYETGFEPFEGFSPNEDLIGQQNWIGTASDLEGNSVPAGGNGVLALPAPGFNGQYAYIGFDAPAKTADSSVWRPINLKPVGQPLPLIRFEVSFQINDSTEEAPFFDDFRWSAYNTDNRRLLSLDFDNETQGVNFILDDQRGNQPPPIVPTGFMFSPGEPYDLQIDFNFQRNLWTARINDAVVVHAQPITSVGAALTLGDVDAVWVIRTPGQPGDNYMIFDDYRISVLPLDGIPPSLEPVGMLSTGAFVVRVLGEPGVTYTLEASTLTPTGPTPWEAVATGVAQSPGAYIDLQDPAAGSLPQRTYRAVSVR